MVICRVAIVVKLIPEGFGVGGHAFFNPGVGPVPNHNQIPKPLVRQLMGDQGFGAQVFELGGDIEQAAICQNRDRGVLHTAENKIINTDLGIFGIRVGIAKPLGEKGDHLGGFAHRQAGLLFATFFDVVGNGAALPLIFEDSKITDGQSHKISRMHLGLSPMPAFAAP